MTQSRSISQQISSLSLSLIAGLLLLSVLAIGTTLLIKTTFVDYRATATTNLLASEIFEDVFEAQASALTWRIASDPAQVEEFRANIAEIRAVEAELEAVSDESPELVQAFEYIKSELNEFEAQFEAMVQARGTYDAIQAEVTDAGILARQQLSGLVDAAYADGNVNVAFYAGRAQEGLLLGRYYLQRYGTTEATEDFERSQKEASAAADELRTLRTALQDPDHIAKTEEAIASVTNFVDRANQLEDALDAQQAARAVIDDLGPQIVANVETIVTAAVARQNTLGPRGIAISFWAVVSICVAGLAIIAIGWLVSKRMSARISGAIEESVSTMTRIAEGDLDAEVRSADAENEIGRMARALEVFKSNGKAAIEAAKREKLAEEERKQAAERLKQQQVAQEAAAREQTEVARKAMIAELGASLGKVVNAASSGDFSQRVSAEFSDRELSDLAANVNTLVHSVENGIAATVEAIERVAQGDLTRQMEGEFKGAFKDLQNNTNGMISSLKSLVVDISGSTVNLAASSQELRDTSDALSKQAEQNAASLEETSAALEELTASIKQVSDNVSDANKNAHFASETAKSSGIVAADAAQAMQRISEASAEIAKVVTVINDIAFQINLLALNAGVEAARAGDAGRGFSVVASEVRQLAQRASEAAKEIDEVIARSDHAVNEGVSKVTNAQESLEKISQSVVGVSHRIDEIANAISEQVTGVGEINTAVSQIDRNTQKQAASFEEVTAASSLLSNEAASLKNSAARFNTGSNVFEIAPVRETQEPPAPQPRTAPARALGNLAEDLDGWDEF